MQRRRQCGRPLTLCGLLIAFGSAAQAQSAPPAVYAIVGARIEIGDGRVIEKGTVVLRDGLIEAVGAEVKAPPDAEVIKGDGLVVYPGFVDAHATAGFKLPDPQPDQDTPPDTTSYAPASMREANRKGVRPEIRAVDYLAFNEAALHPIHQNGFTTELLLPTGGMMNGLAGLVNLSSRPKRDCVVRPVVAEGFAFSTGGRGFGGGYPGSLMGVFAQIRQTLYDARRYRLLQTVFDSGKGQRPPADDTLTALQAVLDGKTPVIFEADSENEIVRAFKVADEFGFKPILSGGVSAYKQITLLTQRRAPLLLSLNFGKEPGAKPAAPPRGERPRPLKDATPPTTDDKPMPPDDPKPAPKEDAESDIPQAAQAERKRLWEEKVATAAELEKAGIPFAFTTKGLRNASDFWDNLRRAIKAGLSREAALRALSLNAAKIFGVDRQFGTVETGKVAALTVMSGDFADAKTKVKYLFIDRDKVEPEKETPSAPPSRPGIPPRDEEDDPHAK